VVDRFRGLESHGADTLFANRSNVSGRAHRPYRTTVKAKRVQSSAAPRRPGYHWTP
jgi:hypothetical protein